VFSLWYPSYSYGISPYIPIVINWLVIGILVYYIWKDLKNTNGSWLVVILLHLGVFTYTYLVTTAIGLLSFLLFIVYAALTSSAQAVQDIAKNGLHMRKNGKHHFVGGYRDVDGLGTLHEVSPGEWEDATGTKYTNIGDGMLRGPGGDYRGRL
jgi:hypothetical protein